MITSNSLEIDHWRFERKFFITDLTSHQVESIVRLHPAMFSEIYHQRYVNNIYIDSPAMTNYFDNITGNSQRVKVRIRWYGDLFGLIEHSALEIKIKSGILGSKVAFPLDTILLNVNFSIYTIRQLIINSNIPDIIKLDLAGMQLVVLNQYSRKYFQSANKKFRITLDTDMRYIRLSSLSNAFLNESYDHINTILELKYEEENDKYAEEITEHFPFRITRSSKYVSGVELLQ